MIMANLPNKFGDKMIYSSLHIRKTMETMESWLEKEKARRRSKVYNWETATYGKIWDNEDVHDLGSVETEFPAIVLNDALTYEIRSPVNPRNALRYSTFRCYPDLGVLQIVHVFSASSAVTTYTSVYTDPELGRVFWGADDEEISDGGISRVIVYGYDGLPMQPVAPPSLDYIPGPEEPQTPPVPQDEDEA
ncbi:hypothetical protein Tco_0647990 [Tanacetum coccineum]